MTPRIPITLIGGYLGAGKTTLVNQMLRQAEGRKLAILVNEFGTLPIDEDLIEAQDDELISIAGGCICCSFGSDLTAALLKLADLTPTPDHIVIEASGVALPGAIAHSVAILPPFTMEGICVLVDSAHAQTLARDEYIGDTITRQFADADLLILSKSDLISSTDLHQLQHWLSEGWPRPRQVIATHGQVPNAVLLGQFSTQRMTPTDGHHDRVYDSVVLKFDDRVDAAAVADQLTQAPLGLLRAKGIVNDLSGRRALIQIVGPRAEVSFPDDAAAPSLICIGLAGQLNHRGLEELVKDQVKVPS